MSVDEDIKLVLELFNNTEIYKDEERFKKELKEKLSEIEFWNLLLDTVELFSKISKCSAKKVACLLYKDNSIVSIGVNGTPPKLINCNEKFKKIDGKWYYKDINGEWIYDLTQTKHQNWSFNNEIHAEINAIGKAAKSGISTIDSIAVVNYCPCIKCTLTLISSGIKCIVFRNRYDDSSKSIPKFYEAGIAVINL